MANVESGLELSLQDNSGLSCTTNRLDNEETLDYTSGNLADFLADEKDGMGGCEYVSYFIFFVFHKAPLLGKPELQHCERHRYMDRRWYVDWSLPQSPVLLLLR